MTEISRLPEKISAETFQAWDDRQEGRHEFDGAGVVPMSGDTKAHMLITEIPPMTLRRDLDATRFDRLREFRLELPDAKRANFRYPDGLIIKGGADLGIKDDQRPGRRLAGVAEPTDKFPA